MTGKDLSEGDKTLIAAFVNAHRAYEAHASKADVRAQSLFEQRQEALREATLAGVSRTVLSQESDLSAGRISQLCVKLGLARPRRERVEA